MIHLCAVVGNMDEALMVLSMMHEDRSLDSKPDCYTYASLLKAVVNTKQWGLLPSIYRDMRRSQVRSDAPRCRSLGEREGGGGGRGGETGEEGRLEVTPRNAPSLLPFHFLVLLVLILHTLHTSITPHPSRRSPRTRKCGACSSSRPAAPTARTSPRSSIVLAGRRAAAMGCGSWTML
jgi:pentatricopeptide repeat protein